MPNAQKISFVASQTRAMAMVKTPTAEKNVDMRSVNPAGARFAPGWASIILGIISLMTSWVSR